MAPAMWPKPALSSRDGPCASLLRVCVCVCVCDTFQFALERILQQSEWKQLASPLKYLH